MLYPTLKRGGSIYIKKSKRGSLHRYLGVPQGEKIPASKLSIKSGDSSAIKKKKQFAINARGWSHKEFGGNIYDQYPEGQVPYGTTNNSGGFNASGGTGLIGGLIGLGNQIGSRVREGAERYDESTGLYQNKNKAVLAGTAGVFADPSKYATEVLMNPDATKREKVNTGLGILVPGLALKGMRKRYDRLEKERVAQIHNQSNFAASDQRILDYQNNGFKCGGKLMEYKSGGVPAFVDYKGNTHQNGGIPIGKGMSPSVASGNEPTAVVEGKETGWRNYVFSNSIPYKKRK